MEKGKIIPIVVAIVLIAVAIYIVVSFQGNKKSFETLYITYKDNKQEYKDVMVDNVIVINNISFWVVSTAKDAIVLNSSEYLLDGKEMTNEFEIKLNETKSACIVENDCMYFELK